MDPGNPVASAVLIEDGVFTKVGRHVDAAGARVVNLRGRTVVPGLIEGHVHSSASPTGPATTRFSRTRRRSARSRRRWPRGARACPQGQWITSMGGWHPNQWAEHRHPTLTGTRRGRARSPGAALRAVHRPVRHEQPGQEVLRRRSTPAPPVHPDIKRSRSPTTARSPRRASPAADRQRSALFHLRRMQTFEDKKRSTLDAMAYSASVGLTAHLDQVLFPTPGPLHPNQILSNLDQYRMYDSWLALHREGKTHRPAADELPAEPERPGAAGAERAAAQPVPVLRRRHDDDRLDRRVGGAARRRRRLARGAAAGRAGRLAQREQRAEPGRR